MPGWFALTVRQDGEPRAPDEPLIRRDQGQAVYGGRGREEAISRVLVRNLDRAASESHLLRERRLPKRNLRKRPDEPGLRVGQQDEPPLLREDQALPHADG